MVAILAALCAAALFAIAAALQHRSAGLVTDADTVRTAGVAAFVSETLRHPLWVAGSIADIVGFGLHAVAVRDGPLTLVQPLLVTGVLFALPLRRVLEHRHPRREELGWAAALAVGLVFFLTISTPTNGAAQAADPVPTVISFAVVGLAILVCSFVGRRSSGGTAAVTLGVGAGLAFAGTAGLLKETMEIVNRGPGALFTTWPLYALDHRRRYWPAPQSTCLPGRSAAFQSARGHHRRPDRQPGHRSGRLRREVSQRNALPGRGGLRAGAHRRRGRAPHSL